MQRRYNLTHLISASIIVLGLTPLMVCVDAQTRIAFVSERDGNHEIYVMDDDGGNPRNLTNNRHEDSSPSWSPDGKRIVFRSKRDGNHEIYVMDDNGENQRRLTKNRYAWLPSWSPDGKRIAFASDRNGNFEIYVMDDDGENRRNLTKNRQNDFSPAWFNPR